MNYLQNNKYAIIQIKKNKINIVQKQYLSHPTQNNINTHYKNFIQGKQKKITRKQYHDY